MKKEMIEEMIKEKTLSKKIEREHNIENQTMCEWLEVEDVRDFISRIQENAFYVGGDLFVRLDFIEKIAGGRLI